MNETAIIIFSTIIHRHNISCDIVIDNRGSSLYLKSV